MVSEINTVSFQGIEVKDISVQVHLAPGLPSFSIVGLPNKAVAESKERVRAAFHSVGFGLPPKRITVNLAPADLLKEGSHFDLAIALGLLAQLQVIDQEELANYIVLGELSLSGEILRANGVLPAAIHANSKNWGVICPKENGPEALLSGNKSIIAASHITELVNHLRGRQLIPMPSKIITENPSNSLDLKDIKGQHFAKRALEIAAAGGHNLLMSGPPGSGKSMLAKRMPSILPPLNSKEILQSCIISSLSGQAVGQNMSIRPFREPHSSCSMAAMIGGGRNAKPGEVTLAHLGVLFLDELPEFSRDVLESLRQPLESSNVTVSRVNSHVTYPANFQLIAAMNPCKCGYFGSGQSYCSKAPRCAEEYQARISGPLMDRFDLKVDVQEINAFSLAKEKQGESSEDMATRVEKARKLQSKRYKNCEYQLNSKADGEILAKYVKLNNETELLLKEASTKFKLSMRGYIRVLRVARTIADLAGSDEVKRSHVAEALNYRVSKL